MPQKKNFDWPASREVTVGMGGLGKTTAFLIRLRGEKAKYYFIFDHKHEIGTALGKDYCYTLDDLSKATAKGGYVVFDPTEMFPGEKLKAFTFFCDFVYQCLPELSGRKILVCDELDQLHTKNKRPRELMLCLSDARYFQMDFRGVGQATNSLHNEVRGQMTGIFTFRQNEENAVKDLRDRGFNDDEIRGLEPGEWIYRSINSPEAVKGGSAFQIKSPSIGSSPVAGKRSAMERRNGKNGDKRKHISGARSQNSRTDKKSDRPDGDG